MSLFRALRSRLVAVPKLPVTNVIAMLRCFPHTSVRIYFCHSDPTLVAHRKSQSLMDRHPGDTSAANDATIHMYANRYLVSVLLASPCHASPCLASPCCAMPCQKSCGTTGGDGTSRHHACPQNRRAFGCFKTQSAVSNPLETATPLMTGSACFFCCVLLRVFVVGTEGRWVRCAPTTRVEATPWDLQL